MRATGIEFVMKTIRGYAERFVSCWPAFAGVVSAADGGETQSADRHGRCGEREPFFKMFADNPGITFRNQASQDWRRPRSLLGFDVVVLEHGAEHHELKASFPARQRRWTGRCTMRSVRTRTGPTRADHRASICWKIKERRSHRPKSGTQHDVDMPIASS